MCNIRIIIVTAAVLTVGLSAMAWAVPAAWDAPPPSAASGRLLHQAIRAIRRQENTTQSIRIRAQSNFFSGIYKPKLKKWVWQKKPMNVFKLTAVFDGLPYGKFRAEVPRDWTTWPDGPQPVSADRFIVAYNGRFGTYLETHVGSPKRELPYNHGNVSADMPPMRSVVDEASGWTRSIYGFTSDLPFRYRVRFSAYIRPDQKWAWVHAGWVHWRGKRYLQVIRVGDPNGKYIFLLDPRRGFSIAHIEYYGWSARKTTSGRVYLVPGVGIQGYSQVEGFFEPIPGVYFPKHIMTKTFDKSTQRFRTKCKIVVSKVIANAPGVNDDTYVIHFPRGAIVRDLVTNKVIRIGGTPQQQLETIERAVRAVRKGLAKP